MLAYLSKLVWGEFHKVCRINNLIGKWLRIKEELICDWPRLLSWLTNIANNIVFEPRNICQNSRLLA